MDAQQLKAAQAAIKEQYRKEPETAIKTLFVRGEINPAQPSVRFNSHLGVLEAGMHPAAGGTGQEACSGNMLLEALAACSGVTLKAVAIAMGIELRKAVVIAEGDIDFKGTLGISKEVPVGFSSIRLKYELDTEATDQQISQLLTLAERYCVIYQTLKQPPELTVDFVKTSNR